MGKARFLSKKMIVPRSPACVYAIMFDFDVVMLERTHPMSSLDTADFDVQSFLENRGFTRHASSMYFGDETIDAVKCILTVQKLAKKHPWFMPSVLNLRMLRVEENCDLSVALFDDVTQNEFVMCGLNPRINLSSQDDGLPGDARQSNK